MLCTMMTMSLCHFCNVCLCLWFYSYNILFDLLHCYVQELHQVAQESCINLHIFQLSSSLLRQFTQGFFSSIKYILVSVMILGEQGKFTFFPPAIYPTVVQGKELNLLFFPKCYFFEREFLETSCELGNQHYFLLLGIVHRNWIHLSFQLPNGTERQSLRIGSSSSVYEAEDRKVDLRGLVYVHNTMQYWADTSLAPKNTVGEVMWCSY